MSVWYCIPSKRPAEEANPVLKLWRDQGYKIALYLDDYDVQTVCDEFMVGTEYPGYAQASNALVQYVLTHDRECDWVVLGGDDVEPDLNHTAEDIARQCEIYFIALNAQQHGGVGYTSDETFGVMQPTGDRYGEDARSIVHYGPDRAAYADRVCGSPWIGREFALRINQGRGPLWSEYTHMFEDEELFHVAQNYGVLWQRRDLVQYHRHWARKRASVEDMPEFLKEANSPEHWRKFKALFERRKSAGFPGSEAL